MWLETIQEKNSAMLAVDHQLYVEKQRELMGHQRGLEACDYSWSC
jgi:hypothetical protein